MEEYDFKKAKKHWSKPPFDGVGYVSSKMMLTFSKSKIEKFVKTFETTRYNLNCWRNHENLWRSTLGLDDTTGKTIIDFGCGFGIESLQFCYKNNEIILADISEDNLKCAEYVINTMGYRVKELVLLTNEDPFLNPQNKYDIFYSCGVLHHTPNMPKIIKSALNNFKDKNDIEYRLMLYSDKAWTIETGFPLIRKIPIYQQRGFYKYCNIMDELSEYADWYDEKKLNSILPKELEVSKYTYIGKKDRYSTSIVKNKKE
jgi:2-polyprenyl-3-methyl-5-hydroxy-6-metoxy-1,4-benzoquinol methylase